MARAVSPTLVETGEPLIVVLASMVMVVRLAGTVAPLASKTTAKRAGAPVMLTVAEGRKWHVTPLGRLPQLKVTIPERLVGVICTLVGGEKELFTMVRLAGEGVARKSAGAAMFT